MPFHKYCLRPGVLEDSAMCKVSTFLSLELPAILHWNCSGQSHQYLFSNFTLMPLLVHWPASSPPLEVVSSPSQKETWRDTLGFLDGWTSLNSSLRTSALVFHQLCPNTMLTLHRSVFILTTWAFNIHLFFSKCSPPLAFIDIFWFFFILPHLYLIMGGLLKVTHKENLHIVKSYC